MTALKVAFPTKVDITKISNCKQRRDEMVADYYTRLHLLFNDHGGMTEPTERGDTPTLWESHMIKWFLDGLLPHISADIKKSCVGYEDARLTDLIRHAKHAENQITAEKGEGERQKRETGSGCPSPPAQNFRQKNMAGKEQQRPARNWRGPGFNRRGRDHGRRGRMADRAEDIRGWERMSATYAGRRAGVIVPCNDSPVRTPIFPVKKVRDEGAPTEWREYSTSTTVLPFRYSLAPRTFSRCVETVLEPLRRTGMRVLFYLDDLLLLARSKEEAAVQTMTLVVHLSNLGFAINWKSSPLPSQQVIYLGVELDSVSMRAQLSQQREGALTALLHLITPHNVVTALSVMQLLGMMSAGHVTVPLGLLHMRRLQRWFIRLCVDPIRQRRCMVSIPPSVGPDLAYWGNPHVLSVGVPLGRVTSHISVFTDASLSGWGGTCLTETVGGQWPAHMSLHINALELLTVWKVIQHFAPLLQNQHVLIGTDNRAVAAYITRQGGVCSAQLLNIARKLLDWAHTHLLSIRAMYIPGEQNRGADIMSRGGHR
ncbi:hypothetical protein L3Q82_006016 [Scortum barcoo]|uniref:Uncharacterized protein n=1 Tax=Scortum barcoo TaxID=214431 RepID=A0ACB8X5E6_9TELE|nr:hypothetical protein L3Q82_006016 [Scortum barcoo]